MAGAGAGAGAVQATPQEPGALAAQYAQLGAAGGRVMRLQPEASQIRIYVFRGGRAVNLGHNHVLSVPEFEGFFYWPEQGGAAARFDLEFRLDQLVFDVPSHRATLGPAFAAVLSDAAIAATREHMLGPDNMQADRYPLLRIRSLEITGEAPKFAARVAIELHGQTREMRVPMTVTGLPQRVNASGALVLRQSDFGVQPYSVMNGLLAVQDDVVVEFSLVGQ
jgi:polyisoprenoid-binding protein YceI